MQVADNEIVITRLIDAPRDRVWRAWTQPAELEQWWGPNGFSVTTQDIDVRIGGEWNFIMHGPDGRDYPNKIRFTHMEEPTVIEHDHGGDDGKVQFHAIITFEAQDDKTQITMRSIFPTKEARDYVVSEYGALEGAKQTIGRLADYVENMR